MNAPPSNDFSRRLLPSTFRTDSLQNHAIFLLFCAFGASTWLLPSVGQTFREGANSQAFLLLFVGVVLIVLRRRSARWRQNALLAAAGVLLFGAPILLMSWFPSGSSVTRTAIAGLIPVMICVASPIDKKRNEFASPHLLASVIGLGGLLLLLPVVFPQDLRGGLLLLPLLAAMGCVAIGSVWLPVEMEGKGFSEILASVCLPNAILLLLDAWILSDKTFLSVSLGSILSSLDSFAQLALFLWLARRMAALQLAARFLIIPIFTAAEGFVLIRGNVTVRMGAGVVLALCSAACLLRSDPEESFLRLSLR